MTSYPKSKQIGNKGESFFESLISDYALVHKIDGSKDVGLDFLCEWVSGETPTQLLFGVQVKTRSGLVMGNKGKSNLNHLQQFQGGNIRIKKTTLDYWQGFDFPVFLFLINIVDNTVSCFYKRYTTIVQKLDEENDVPFFQVAEGNKFLAFAENNTEGFARDLFIDHVRCQHNKGMLTGIDPKNLGLNYYQKDVLYKGVFEYYRDKIKNTYQKYEQYKEYFF